MDWQRMFSRKKIVVTQYPELAEHMKKRGFQVCLNDQPELGISHSVHLGAEEAWKWEPDAAICFAVSDQPYLRGTTLEMLIRQWKASGKGIGALAYHEEIGNPVVFAEKYRKELMELTGDKGGKRVVKRAYGRSVFNGSGRCRELRDLDTKPV